MAAIRFNKKKHLKFKIIINMIVITMIIIILLVHIDRKVTPTMQAIGELKAQEITTKAIGESVNLVLEQDIQYQDLIFIKEDTEGNITMMQANTFLMNRIASDVGLTIQEHLKHIKTSTERIPLSNILGNQLLSQYGPKVKLTLTPLGAVEVNFGTEFEQSGINQTRHRIYLIINTSVRVVIPFSHNTIHVTTYFPVAETIIVGKVPMNYISVPKDQFLNVTPLYEK